MLAPTGAVRSAIAMLLIAAATLVSDQPRAAAQEARDDRQALRHGADLDGVLAAARFIWTALGRTEPDSKLVRAGGWPR